MPIHVHVPWPTHHFCSSCSFGNAYSHGWRQAPCFCKTHFLYWTPWTPWFRYFQTELLLRLVAALRPLAPNHFERLAVVSTDHCCRTKPQSYKICVILQSSSPLYTSIIHEWLTLYVMYTVCHVHFFIGLTAVQIRVALWLETFNLS